MTKLTIRPCSSVNCDNTDAKYKIRERTFCTDCYIQALEHGADIVLNLPVMFIPPIRRQKLTTIFDVNKDLNRINRTARQRIKEADLFYVRPE